MGGHPIARVWSGHVPSAQAEGFHRHLLATGVAEAHAVEGNLGASVLRRTEGDRVRFTLLTIWSDAEAVRRFAGDDVDAARLYPGDDRFGLMPEHRATLHDIVQPERIHAFAIHGGWPDPTARTPVRHAYLQAAACASALLRDPAVAASWHAPSALPHYTVGGLAGHLAGQIFFIPRVLAEPVPDGKPISILDYYQRVSWMNADHDDEVHVRIRQGGVDAATGGPTSLASRVAASVERLRDVLAAEPVQRLVRLPSWAWSLTLDDFVLSRTVELVVHCDDLAVSAGVATPSLPAPVLDIVVDLLSRLAVRRHGPTAVLRALSRAERASATIAAF